MLTLALKIIVALLAPTLLALAVDFLLRRELRHEGDLSYDRSSRRLEDR